MLHASNTLFTVNRHATAHGRHYSSKVQTQQKKNQIVNISMTLK